MVETPASHLTFEYLQEDGFFYMLRTGRLAAIVWKKMDSCPDDVFAEHCDVFQRTTQRHGPFQAAVTYSSSFHPTAKQRAMVGDRAAAMGIRTLWRGALVTDSLQVRGAVRAISWMGGAPPEIKPFTPNQLEQALDWCAESLVIDREVALRGIRRGIELVRG